LNAEGIFANKASQWTTVDLQSLLVDETVDCLPPFPLPVSGQGAEQGKGKAPWLAEWLLAHTADLGGLLELTMAAEHHPAHKHLETKRTVNPHGKRSDRSHSPPMNSEDMNNKA